MNTIIYKAIIKTYGKEKEKFFSINHLGHLVYDNGYTQHVYDKDGKCVGVYDQR